MDEELADEMEQVRLGYKNLDGDSSEE
jgi:hypothetical protein